jgi:hypothetical protein
MPDTGGILMKPGRVPIALRIEQCIQALILADVIRTKTGQVDGARRASMLVDGAVAQDREHPGLERRVPGKGG